MHTNVRKKVSARSRLQPGKASDYIKLAATELSPGDKVICWARESIAANASHLDDQLAALRKASKSLGVIEVGHYTYIGPGYAETPANAPYDPITLSWMRAAALAKEYSAKLFATETDRFVRHPAYGADWPTAQARLSDLADLQYHTDGVTLVTLADPDALPGTARSLQTKRGQAKLGGNKPGRPTQAGYKKRKRERLITKVRGLKEAGLSNREIAKLTRVKRSTIGAWLKRAF